MVIPKTISLVGHSGSGKSTLAKNILNETGVDGDINFDPSEEEKKRGYSIDLGVGHCEWKDEKLNILDTPGGAEFIEEVYKGVYAGDASVLLLDSEKGIEVQTETVWNVAQKYDKPTIAVVNKLEKESADFAKVIDDLRENLQGTFVALQLPLFKDGEFSGIVDLIDETAISFGGSREEIPERMSSLVESERNALMEELAQFNDELMLSYLEDEPIKQENIEKALHAGMRENEFTPVLCGPSFEKQGVDLFLDCLLRLVPTFSSGDDSRTQGIVFNQIRDPYLGKLSFVKVFSGELNLKDSLYNPKKNRRYDVQDIYLVQANDQKKVKKAGPASVVALGKMEELELGDNLCSSEDQQSIEFVDFPNPVFSRAIAPESKSDETKMSTALRELASIKATIRYSREEVTKELILSGMGDTHLDVFKERLKNGFNVSILMSEPKIPYKRSVAKKANAKYRHKKQTGGRGQYAEVYLRITPLVRGEGVKFENEIKGGNIPKQFIPGVEKGVYEALEEGYPITDLKATVYDGDHHPVDSSEMAFKIAGRQAFKEAVKKAQIILLEPIMLCSITTPGDYTGDIVSDLNGRRARIQGTEMVNGDTVVRAEVPQAEVQNYALELKSLTQGKASVQMEFVRYKRVPDNIASKIMSKEQ